MPVEKLNFVFKIGYRAHTMKWDFDPEKHLENKGFSKELVRFYSVMCIIERMWASLKLTIQIINRTEVRAFRILPRRWVVERTFGWFGFYRRLVKDYERYPKHSEAFVYIAMSNIMLNRLARSFWVSTHHLKQKKWNSSFGKPFSRRDTAFKGWSEKYRKYLMYGLFSWLLFRTVSRYVSESEHDL